MATALLRRILVVDDSATNLLLLQTFLEGQGYQVETATDGLAALATMQLDPPDLVLLDLTLPLMDGYAVIQHMRQEAQLAAVPVILVTAQDEEDVRSRVSQANGVVGKPIRFPKLLAVIRSCCPDPDASPA